MYELLVTLHSMSILAHILFVGSIAHHMENVVSFSFPNIVEFKVCEVLFG